MKRKIWGQTLSLDLRECDKKILTSKKKLTEFPVLLCQKIKMKPYGKPRVERFAEGVLEGYSMMQFIETSSITAHLDEVDSRAFIDIFSCKTFDHFKAKKFCQEFFKAKRVSYKNFLRY